MHSWLSLSLSLSLSFYLSFLSLKFCFLFLFSFSLLPPLSCVYVSVCIQTQLEGIWEIWFPLGGWSFNNVDCRYSPDFPTRYRADLKNIVFVFAITRTSK